MSHWVTSDPFSTWKLPTCAAVYVISINGVAVYVGQSNSLRQRIQFHKFRYGYGRNMILPWCDIHDTNHVTIKYKTTKVIGDWAMWEIRLIHRLQPRYNRTLLKLKKVA